MTRLQTLQSQTSVKTKAASQPPCESSDSKLEAGVAELFAHLDTFGLAWRVLLILFGFPDRPLNRVKDTASARQDLDLLVQKERG